MVVVAVTCFVVKGRRKNNYSFVIEHPTPNSTQNDILKNLSGNLPKKQETLTSNPIKDRIDKTKKVLSGKENVIQTGFNCNKCKATFTTKYHLNKHMKAHSQAKNKFKTKTHNQESQGKNKFKCFPCNKIFITKIGLAQHKEKSHTNRTDASNRSDVKQNLDNFIPVPNKPNKSTVVGNLVEMFPSMDKGTIEMVVSQFETMEASMNALLSLAATDPLQTKISLPQGRIPGPAPPTNSSNSNSTDDCVCKDEFYWPEPGHVCTNQPSILGF